jgi:plastocyanin
MRGKAIAAAVLVLGGTGAAAAASPTAQTAKTKTVKVADNFYSPKKLTVAKGATIKWVWSNRNADSHDVYLYKKPKGAKHFQSAPAATFFTFKRKLKKAGTYKLLCTFHEGMKMRIDVKN